jgi:hypothetical protein
MEEPSSMSEDFTTYIIIFNKEETRRTPINKWGLLEIIGRRSKRENRGFFTNRRE